MSKYRAEQQFLKNHCEEILQTLGKTFDSNDFINAFHRLYPNEYAQAIQRAGTHSSFNSWAARWFLSRCRLVEDMGQDKKARKSINQNETRNHRWRKL